MKQYRVMTLSLFLAAVMAITWVGCGGESAKTTEPSQAPADREERQERPKVEAPAEPSEAATEPAAAEEPSGSATEPAAGEALTATTIVGTSWEAGGMTFTFNEGGALKVKMGDMEMDGEWSLDGTSLSVGAMGTTYEATIEGDKIVRDGQPLTRIQ